MSQVCELTGKKPLKGHNVSHANNKTKKTWNLNLHKKRYFVPELRKTVAVRVTTRAIRTIDKLGGLAPAIMKAKTEKLSDKLLRLKKDLQKA